MEQWYDIAVKVKQSHGMTVITKIHSNSTDEDFDLQLILMSVDHISTKKTDQTHFSHGYYRSVDHINMSLLYFLLLIWSTLINMCCRPLEPVEISIHSKYNPEQHKRH